MVHIQQASNTSTLEAHWGYASRVLPCTNDAGTCEYLDAVYWMHDVSMLYTFIMWAVFGAVFMIAVVVRFLTPSPQRRSQAQALDEQGNDSFASGYFRIWRGSQAFLRRWLLPESFVGVFGNVTRLQLLVLAVLLGYLLVFSLVGIVYKTWITPVKLYPKLHNTRTGLGGFSDRVGALAYALTPLTVALSTRESILTLATGIPYQSFNFLHRWLGRVIFIQSFLHTLGWTLIEGRFYKPQPSIYTNFMKELYIIWGVIAMIFITFLYIFSLKRVIRLTGHEFFRKAHYIVACLYIGACWGHWNQLACWMIASLGIFGIDRGIRLLRTLFIHIGYIDKSSGFGFHPAQASIQYFSDEDGGVVRLEFDHNHDPWAVGQHFFLCFPALTIWQSHPMTVASVPLPHPSISRHIYVIRCRKGETRRLRDFTTSHQEESIITAAGDNKSPTTPVILCGPYGTPLLAPIANAGLETTNILAVAGGTGVSLTLPIVLAATSSLSFKAAAIDFVWILRRVPNIQWISTELEDLKSRSKNANVDLRIHIYVTQESGTSSKQPSVEGSEKSPVKLEVDKVVPAGSSMSSERGYGNKNFDVTYLNSQHPSLETIVFQFLEQRANTDFRTRVIASGPSGMGNDLRQAVAKVNDGGKVFRGENKFDVDLHWDDRMG